MARTDAVITASEEVMIGELNGIANSKVAYKNSSGVWEGQNLGTGDMVLASVQTVTGLKTFDTTKLAVKGSSTGSTAIASANAGATDYTATLQAGSGTVAYTADITGTNSGTNTGDNATNTTSNTYADGKVADAINDGTTTIAPSQNAVFDALALKAPLTAPTFATSITGSYLTASEILGTGASKEVISLPVATYPSLTELSYVKGVTSAIQTQITAKMANPMTTGGDVIYGGASGAPTRLANGTAGQVLTSGGTTVAPTWTTPSGGAFSGFQATMSAPQTISGETLLAFNTETFDIGSQYNNSTYTFTAGTTGYYKFDLSLALTTTSAVLITLLCRLNGGIFMASECDSTASSRRTGILTGIVYLTASQYLNFYCSTAGDTTESYRSILSVYKIA